MLAYLDAGTGSMVVSAVAAGAAGAAVAAKAAWRKITPGRRRDDTPAEADSDTPAEADGNEGQPATAETEADG